MEKAFPEARAGALPRRSRIRVRRVEFPGLLQVALTLLESGVPGVPPRCDGPPEAAGVQVLHRPLPDVPPAHASALSAQTHRGVCPLHGGQRCHTLHLHQ